jgi:exonuclease III
MNFAASSADGVPQCDNAADDFSRKVIRLATYNIRSARGGNLESVLRALNQMNVDFCLLCETKLSDDRFTKFSSGYRVFASKAPSSHQGGVALVYRQSPYWQIESERVHGPNVISFELVSGPRRTLIIGAYIPPGDRNTIEFVHQAANRRLDLPIMLMGDLNVDLSDLLTARAADIAALIASLGLIDLLSHFYQRRRHGNRATWHQNRGMETLYSRCDYILGTDRRFFRNVQIKQPRLFTSDHFLLLGELLSEPLGANRRYLGGRRQFPLSTSSSSELNSLFSDLQNECKEQFRSVRPFRSSWISTETWRLIDHRAERRRQVDFSFTEDRRLTRQIQRSLWADRKRRLETAGQAIESHLAGGDLKEAWQVLKGWYYHTTGRPMRPSYQDMWTIEREYGALFSATPSPGDPIPVLVPRSDVDDAPPTEAEIASAVRRLRSGKVPGPSGIRTEHLKNFLKNAERSENPDSTAWDKLVLLVRTMFTTGELPEAMSWALLVLLPKPSGGIRGIGLLEVIWKVCSSIVDARLKASISLHDSLHGFRSSRGTGTAILELILRMQLSHIQHRPLYLIFLDLTKAYDTLDRDRTLEILKGYGIGPNVIRLLQTFWNNLQVVARQSGYHSSPFRVSRGVTQGDIISPMIFNIVVDAIIRYWYQCLSLESFTGEGDGSIPEVSAGFYADDGVLAAYDPDQLQSALDLLVELFERVGLATSIPKTKVMVCLPDHLHAHLSSPAYKRRFEGGLTYNARKRRKILCTHCQKEMQECHLSSHLLHKHNICLP